MSALLSAARVDRMAHAARMRALASSQRSSFQIGLSAQGGGQSESSGGEAMSSGNGNPWDDDPATNPWLNRPGGDTPQPGRFSDPTSRRRFLRTAVAAGAVVAGTGAIGGIVLANKKPGIVSSVLAGRSTPSGHCVTIAEAVKGTPDKPNHEVQVLTTDFTAYIGTITGNPPVFTIVHPYAVLTDDKNNSNPLPDIVLCIKSAAYKEGGPNPPHVTLTVEPGIVTPDHSNYQSGDCLYVSQTRTC
jgi:hypothetical protein